MVTVSNSHGDVTALFLSFESVNFDKVFIDSKDYLSLDAAYIMHVSCFRVSWRVLGKSMLGWHPNRFSRMKIGETRYIT